MLWLRHPAGMEGFSLGRQIVDKCGMRASSTGELVFEDVKVPTENLLGEIGNRMNLVSRPK